MYVQIFLIKEHLLLLNGFSWKINITSNFKKNLIQHELKIMFYIIEGEYSNK